MNLNLINETIKSFSKDFNDLTNIKIEKDGIERIVIDYIQQLLKIKSIMYQNMLIIH